MINSTSAAVTRVVVVVEDDPAILALCRVTFQRAQEDLLRDDHEVVRQGLAALLGRRSEFHVVAEAGTVAEAVAAARRFRPDLIVMDVRLPDGSGLDLVRDLRRSGTAGRTRVIIASASVLPAEREAALAAGADRFLPKPYRPADLVAAVVDLLGEPSQ